MTRPNRLSRRLFLSRSIGWGAASLTLGIGCADDRSGASPAFGSGGKTDNLEFDENGICLSGTTGSDALGPYWTPNIRETSQLASPTQIGQPLFLAGHVYTSDCVTPIPGAYVVAWQADDDGLYDYNHAGLNSGSGEGMLTRDQTNLRGLVVTGIAGTFGFSTIFPSEYPLNLLDPATSAYRAPHIHFAVFCLDRFGQQHALVTQMYFTPTAAVLAKVPDLDALNAADGGASTAEATRFVAIEGGSGALWQGQFDIVMPLPPSALPG